MRRLRPYELRPARKTAAGDPAAPRLAPCHDLFVESGAADRWSARLVRNTPSLMDNLRATAQALFLSLAAVLTLVALWSLLAAAGL